METTLIKSEKKAGKISIPENMTAAILTAPGQFEWQEVSVPEPKANEVLIRMEGCGLCASNIPVWQGRDWFDYPNEAGSPGHEGYGLVVKTGAAVTDISPGDRVSALTYNAFAEYDIAPSDHVVKIPEDLNDMAFPGEPLGCAMNIFGRSDIRNGQKVAIVGAGFLGLLLVQLAKSTGAEVIAISRRQYSLDSAKMFGAHAIALNDHQQVIEEVKRKTGGKWCDRVIEATGNEQALNLAAEITGVRGKLIVAGFHQDGFRNVNMQLWNWRGIDVINAHERDPNEYIRGIKCALRATQCGIIRPEELFTHFYSKEEINIAFSDLEERPAGFIKGIVKL